MDKLALRLIHFDFKLIYLSKAAVVLTVYPRSDQVWQG